VNLVVEHIVTTQTTGFTDPMFSIQCTTFVELWVDCSKWVIFTKNSILQWKILKLGRLGVKNFWNEVPKNLYAKSGRINRLAYVAIVVFK